MSAYDRINKELEEEDLLLKMLALGSITIAEYNKKMARLRAAARKDLRDAEVDE